MDEEPSVSPSGRNSMVSQTPAPAAPGKVGGRVDFGINESVVRMEVLPQVKQARKDVEESVLAARRNQSFTNTTEMSPNKHGHKFSDQKLSNTLTPELLNSSDTRKLLGTTHLRTIQRSPDIHGMGTSTSYGDWNTSTITGSPKASAQQLEQLTATSLSKTRPKALGLVATGRYVDPISRVEAMNEAIRAKKSNPGGNWEELVAQYGPEGAAAMQQILKMKPRETKTRIRTTADDLAAVKALDEVTLDQEVDEEPVEEVNLAG